MVVAILVVMLLAVTVSAAPKQGGTLVIGKEAEAVGLDPHKAIGFSVRELHELVYNGLVTVDADLKVVPDLAASWENPDPQTYIFHLRPNATFHNGRQVTAADVKYSIDRILDPDTKSTHANRLSGIASVEVVDALTLKITLEAVNAAFLADLAGGVGGPQPLVVPREAVEEHGDLQGTMVGTGPFKLAEYVPDNVTLLVRHNGFYIADQPYLDEVRMVIMPDEASRLAALRAGRIHLTELRQIENVQQARSMSGVKVLEQPATNFYALQINTKRAPFDDVRVRQAISLAIDRNEVLMAAVGGEASLLGPVPPALAQWALPVSEYELYQYNVDRAKQLLAEAGYANGFSTSITASQQYPLLVTNAQIIQAQLERVGIKAEIKLVEWGQYINAWRSRDYDLMTGLDSFAADPHRLFTDFHTSGRANVYQLSDSELDTLLESGVATLDLAKRKEIYDAAQRRIVELAPKIYLYAPKIYAAIRDSVKGYQQMPNEWRLYLKETWLEK